MSTYKQLRNVIDQMELDLGDLKNQTGKRYLTEYEQGFSDGAVETMEATLKFMKGISKQLASETWEETPPTPRADGDWGDVPPIRTGMGG